MLAGADVVFEVRDVLASEQVRDLLLGVCPVIARSRVAPCMRDAAACTARPFAGPAVRTKRGSSGACSNGRSGMYVDGRAHGPSTWYISR